MMAASRFSTSAWQSSGASEQIAAGHRQAATQKKITDPGTVLGTVGYMAPEQVRGQEADHRADIFAFGVILYEMLSGRRPFGGESSIEVMNAILERRAAGAERDEREDQPTARKDRAAVSGEETRAAGFSQPAIWALRSKRWPLRDRRIVGGTCLTWLA